MRLRCLKRQKAIPIYTDSDTLSNIKIPLSGTKNLRAGTVCMCLCFEINTKTTNNNTMHACFQLFYICGMTFLQSAAFSLTSITETENSYGVKCMTKMLIKNACTSSDFS